MSDQDRIDLYQQQEDEINVALGGCVTNHQERVDDILELRKRLKIASISQEAMAEVKATIDGHSEQTIREIVNGCIYEISMLKE